MTVLNPVPECCLPLEQFWCRSSLRISVTHAEGVTEFVVERPYAIVGSHPQADVCLSQPGIPKRALLLYASADGVFCRSLEKDYPGIGKGIYLLPDDVIDVDGYQVQVSEQLAEDHFVSPPESDSEGLEPELAIVPKEGKRFKRRMKEPLQIVGRNRNCEIRLQEASLSACHCAILWHEQRLWAIDLLSGNGSYVLGQKIECVQLSIGDLLMVGSQRIVFYRLQEQEITHPGSTDTIQFSAHTETIRDTFRNLTRALETEKIVPPVEAVPGETISDELAEPVSVAAVAPVESRVAPATIAESPVAEPIFDSIAVEETSEVFESMSLNVTVDEMVTTPLIDEAIAHETESMELPVSQAKWLELQAAYEQSQAELGDLRGELFTAQAELKQVHSAFEQLRVEISLTQQARDAAQRSQQELSVLNERLTGEIAGLQQLVQQQNHTLNEQRESHAHAMMQLQADRNRISDHLSSSVQQVATLNQSFSQLQMVVGELRAEIARKKESRESDNADSPMAESRSGKKPLLQPQMGVLIRTTPVMETSPASSKTAIPSLPNLAGKKTASPRNNLPNPRVIDSTSSNASETILPSLDASAEAKVYVANPLRGKSKSDQDDKLTHFVSDRLGQIESTRRMTMLIIWLVTFLFTALILVGVGILLKSWDNHPLQP